MAMRKAAMAAKPKQFNYYHTETTHVVNSNRNRNNNNYYSRGFIILRACSAKRKKT